MIELKRTKIEEVLTYIEERLLELEAEKTELSEYQEFDKERRSIEYTIYAREQASANRKLDDLEEERRRHVNSGDGLRESYAKNEDTVQVKIERRFIKILTHFKKISNIKLSFVIFNNQFNFTKVKRKIYKMKEKN